MIAQHVKGLAGAALGGMVLAGLLATSPPTTRADARDGKVAQVRGTVTDASGAPVPGHVVRLLKSRTIVDLAGRTTRDQNVEEVRTTADEHGSFALECPIDAQFRYYYLRFYDPKIFDAVKYRLPEDRDISKSARKGRPVEASVVLEFQPDWPKVRALIDEFGAGSACGQVLRALGLPSRRSPVGPGRELWEYDVAKVAYLVEGGKVLETHALSGAAGATPKPEGAGARDEPEPATRVGGP